MADIKYALISVSNKYGLAELGKHLVATGFTILSTGGTEKALIAEQIPVTPVSAVTNFPEILGGRVKTLHPAIHGGILATEADSHQKDLDEHKIHRISVVICNLYPFVATAEKPGATETQVIEEIDIGGVTLLRAAAKNFENVIVISDPSDYSLLLKSTVDKITKEDRKKLALKAFLHTSEYDQAISSYFVNQINGSCQSFTSSGPQLSKTLDLKAEVVQTLRYGENPHQQGALYKWKGTDYPFEQIQGKELSYNNILDIDAALDVVLDFEAPACSIIKHLTPCGIATGSTIVEAYKNAFESDTVSAFGSIIAVNRPVTLELVETIGQLFLEVLVAFEFEADALSWLSKKKKNCRVMKVTSKTHVPLVIRTVHGGLLVQTPDEIKESSSTWKVVSERQPDEQMLKDMEFAWTCVKHVKSNAIVFTQGNATVGIGCGQPNRLDSVRSAATHAGEKSKGAICSSDAFFPFPDGVEAAASHGIKGVVQPGGSMRDEEVIAAANRLGLVMVFTGIRHFKH